MKKIWLMRKILTVLKKVSFCIKGSAKIRREKWLRLPVKNVGFSRIAGRCFCRNAIFLINIGGNAFSSNFCNPGKNTSVHTGNRGNEAQL